MAAEGTDNDDIFQEDDNNNDVDKKVVIDPIKVSFKIRFWRIVTIEFCDTCMCSIIHFYPRHTDKAMKHH